VVPRADARLAWEQQLREREAEALRAAGPTTWRSAAEVAPASAATLAVGDERSFQVPDVDGRFVQVRAVARLVSDRTVFYQDVQSYSGLGDQELAALASDLDDPVIPSVTDTFGSTSDVDANDRVIVLLTPAVNRLTRRDDPGFVAGFFFGVDLIPGSTNSNGAEILYALVPDPEGRYSSPRSAEVVRAALPSTLAHELQHLVHFHQRMRLRSAPRAEALWLSEALAQSAEVLVADALTRRGRTRDAAAYLQPTLGRAREFLAEPAGVSLLGSAGEGTLAERGAGWLFLRYLQGHHGGTQLLRALTWSTRTGLENVEAATSRPWAELFSDWGVATFTDGLIGFASGRLQYPDVQLRQLLSFDQAPYPLAPRTLAGEGAVEGVRLSGSAEYYLLDARGSGTVALQLAGPLGGVPAPEARLILRVVRIPLGGP
jgi:hypothetical protein